MRRRVSVSLAIALVAGSFASFASFGCGGADRPPGTIEGLRREPADVAQQQVQQNQARAALSAQFERARDLPEKQILFGDLHVHTTYSLDAFTVELPMMGLQGIHTPADACDFARYCAELDFFSLNDHAESLTPEHWSETKNVIRQCNELAGDSADPDVVAFAGWEWTQVGATPEQHWGHKNVIFPGLAESELPARPINSRPYAAGIGLFDNVRPVVRARYLDPLNWGEYTDLGWLLDRIDGIPECAKDVDTRELPVDCHEPAPTPEVLYRKLDEWGFDTLVIPHGNAWGIYTPPLASWDKALGAIQHDPDKQRLIEIMSGHGNSEEYRSWRPYQVTEAGLECPAPSADFLPCCWRAGELMRERCGDLPSGECDVRVEEARQLAMQAQAMPTEVFPDLAGADWLDCDQCRDCFKPSYSMRPTESTQYALALTNFDDEDPLRFRFGFIASTDDHTARPGTGYKQYERRKMTFATGIASERFDLLERPDPMDRARAVDLDRLVPQGERVSSFTYPGGIVAVHATSREREAVWSALKAKEVYGTSGPRILLWFDLVNGPGGRQPMGSQVSMSEPPVFEVRAAGAFVQKRGCPQSSQSALSAQRLDRLCAGECYHPDEVRHPIASIEIVRIRPQIHPQEPVEGLIDDPWRTFDCAPDAAGCTMTFTDREFPESDRDALYYVRVLQEATPAINGATMRTKFDDAGNPVSIEPCYGDFRTPLDDDCLAPAQERAWSSPIYVDRVPTS
jgi:hypothetical protein